MNPSNDPSSPLPPRGEFSAEGYLQLHPDVAAAIEAGIAGSAWQHFVLHGHREGRAWIRQPDPLAGVSQEIAPDDEMHLGDSEHYFDVGASALRCVEAALAAADRGRSTVHSILDLPCGHGRVLRFLRHAFPAARLTACDLHRGGVEFCARAFGAAPVVSSVDLDRIPLHGPFDLIWCGSLLTHLPQERWAAFLALFHRLLGPRGLLVFTVHGRGCAADLSRGRSLASLDSERVAALLDGFRERGFGYVDYVGQTGYGFSLAHPATVLERFVATPDWQLLGYHENGWDQRQDVICVRRAQRI